VNDIPHLCPEQMQDDPYEWNALSCIHFPLEFWIKQTIWIIFIPKISPCTGLITCMLLANAKEKGSSGLHWAPSSTVPSPKKSRPIQLCFLDPDDF